MYKDPDAPQLKLKFPCLDSLQDIFQIQCPICNREFDDEKHMPLLVCPNKHRCCNECVQSIMEKQMDCPLCRSSIVKQKIKKDKFALGIFSIFGAIKQSTESTYQKSNILCNQILQKSRELQNQNIMLRKQLKNKDHYIQQLQTENNQLKKIIRQKQINFQDLLVHKVKLNPQKSALCKISYQYLVIQKQDIRDIDYQKKKREDFSLSCIQEFQSSSVQILLNKLSSQINKNFEYQLRLWKIDKKYNLDSLFRHLKIQASKPSYQYRIKGFGELLTNEISLEDLKMQKGDFFVVQARQIDKKWFLQRQYQDKCIGCYNIHVLNFPCRCQKVQYCSQACREKDKKYHQRECESK